MNYERVVLSEILFVIFAFGFLLDEFTAAQEHGWDSEQPNLVNYLDAYAYPSLSLHPKHVEWIRPRFCRDFLDLLGVSVSRLVHTRLLVERSGGKLSNSNVIRSDVPRCSLTYLHVELAFSSPALHSLQSRTTLLFWPFR